jgi:uncharacterized protein YdhG (YjbR/CyaY superfamily)
MKPDPAPATVDEYIAGFPENVREILEDIRTTIRDAAPDLEEAIRYRIPTFQWNGKNVIHFAGYKNHIGLYPAPRRSDEFRAELSAYEGGKGTVQFPLGEPIPFDLIRRIVEFRLWERLEGGRG